MSNQKRGLILVIMYFIIGIAALIVTIIALNRVYHTAPSDLNNQFDGCSVKGMYLNLDNSFASWVLTSTAGMAYIGSIVTLCFSMLVVLYGGFLIFKIFYFRQNIITITNVLIFIVAFLILFSFSIASIMTATHITDWTWVAKFNIHYPIS